MSPARSAATTASMRCAASTGAHGARHRADLADRRATPFRLRPLRVRWLATDQLASKRVRAAVPLCLPHYEAAHGALPSEVRAKRPQISAVTVDLPLKSVRASLGPRGRCGTKHGTLLNTQIPLQGSAWDVSQPGFMETCGPVRR
jgi:hypothetical protein